MDKEQFVTIYGKIYAANFSSHLAENIFRSFDHNRDGYVSFKELMITLSVTTEGTTREKLEWLFRVYDFDGNGKITMDEACHMAKCMSQSSAVKQSHKDAERSEEEKDMYFYNMFESIDSDGNGSWSLEEF